MKIIAFYLPQFHNIPENDLWWGDGFTEWTNVKAAKPLFKGHIQPKIPLNDNYYNLLDDEIKLWQANLAKEYGIYGFCYYHYWYNGKLLLEKPMEQMLNNKKIDLPFCICWANEPWTKIWVGEKKVLYPQMYGGQKEWEEHFRYLLPFLKDSRYIYKNGKPLIFFYNPEQISCINEMVEFWKKCATDEGLPGLTIVARYVDENFMCSNKVKCIDYFVEWQPRSAKKVQKKDPISNSKVKALRRRFYEYLSNVLGVDAYQYSLIAKIKSLNDSRIKSYDEVWENIIRKKPSCKNCIPGAFVRWDNSPRFQKKATIIKGETPQKFKEYLSRQIKHAENDYHQDMLFLFAWNEWAEGGYLEPDEQNGYAYLEAVRDALRESDECMGEKKQALEGMP